MGIIVSSYPKSRPLLLDTSKVNEYELLKDFVNKEKGNFNDSLIFAYIETLKYMAGLDGSILYHNPPKAFNFDFTNASIADRFFYAYHDTMKGNFTLASKLTTDNHVNYVYVVILYSHKLPRTEIPMPTNYNYGDLITRNDAGMVRKGNLQQYVK